MRRDFLAVEFIHHFLPHGGKFVGVGFDGGVRFVGVAHDFGGAGGGAAEGVDVAADFFGGAAGVDFALVVDAHEAGSFANGAALMFVAGAAFLFEHGAVFGLGAAVGGGAVALAGAGLLAFLAAIAVGLLAALTALAALLALVALIALLAAGLLAAVLAVLALVAILALIAAGAHGGLGTGVALHAVDFGHRAIHRVLRFGSVGTFLGHVIAGGLHALLQLVGIALLGGLGGGLEIFLQFRIAGGFVGGTFQAIGEVFFVFVGHAAAAHFVGHGFGGAFESFFGGGFLRAGVGDALGFLHVGVFEFVAGFGEVLRAFQLF